MDALQVVDFFGKTASLAVACMAIIGIGTWRRDFAGKRRIELAEETLVLFYRASDAVKAMRSPLAYGSESDHLVRGDQESDARYAARKTVAPLYKRYEESSELFAEIRATRYRFMARFGLGASEPFDEIRKLVNEILIAGHTYVMVAEDCEDDEHPARKARVEQRQKREAVFWDMGEDDEINARLAEIVSKVDGHCRKIIERQFSPRELFAQFAWWRTTSK